MISKINTKIKEANFRIFIRELGTLTTLDSEEIIDILSNLSTYIHEYKKKKTHSQQPQEPDGDIEDNSCEVIYF